MARAKSKPVSTSADPSSVQERWCALTWDDLERWAGSRSVKRGRSYQSQDRVIDLCVTDDGALLASIRGTQPYATTVSLAPGVSSRLESECTCPVGISCKHAVAVVREYLEALAEQREVPRAAEDDPRWSALSGEAKARDDEEPFDDDDEEEEEEDSDDDDDEEEHHSRRRMRPVRLSARKPRGGPSAAEWNRKIEEHIRSKTQGELADLVVELARDYPALRKQMRETLSLASQDVRQLADEARSEIRRVTSVRVWHNKWTGEGATADYEPISQRLARLLELGAADEVIALGRELLECGLEQVGQAEDEGEAAGALAECLPTVFKALEVSSLSGPERLLLAIEADLADPYDIVGGATRKVLEANDRPENWSVVADSLIDRLRALPTDSIRVDSYHRDYQRDKLTRVIAMALGRAGRETEVRALYETEAPITSSYERLVAYLVEHKEYEAAERWAKEGIVATCGRWPGIVNKLMEHLRAAAAKRRRWDVVAGYAAHDFFVSRPSVASLEALVDAARKAGVEETVHAAALCFLETGQAPFRVTGGRNRQVPPMAGDRAKRARTSAIVAAAMEEPVRLLVDPEWPLPVPEALLPLCATSREGERSPRLDVLIDLAIRQKRPEEVLKWYDRACKDHRPGTPGSFGLRAQAEKVAEAVSRSHPERAIAIYRSALEGRLPEASVPAYEACGAYLKTLRPLYASLGHEGDWTALVALIRERYRNRPRFMEILDRLDHRSIVRQARERRK